MFRLLSPRPVAGACLALILSSWSFAANLGPEEFNNLPTRSLAMNGSPVSITLADFVRDPDVPGTAVRVTVRIGTQTKTLDLALNDQQAPLTVANFLAYINAGRFANNFIHRSVSNFVIQGGGYYFVNDSTYDKVAAFAAVTNEPGISNVRGTIAMAKLPDLPNSATSEWFINLADNASNLDAQNGGFTVFGHVIGTGMTVADEIAAVPAYDTTALTPPLPWDSLPLTTASLARPNFIETNMAVIPALSYVVSSSKPSVVAASITNGVLTLTPSATKTGSATITLTTTDLEGATLTTTFTAKVLDTFALWQAGKTFASAADALPAADPDTDGANNLYEYAFGGDPLAATTIPGRPVPEAGGGVVFYQRTQSALLYTVQSSTDLVTWKTVWKSTDGLSDPAVFAHTSATGFDVITIRPVTTVSPAHRFWRVTVATTL